MRIKLALLSFGAFFIIVIARKCDFANLPILQFSINKPVKLKICGTSTTTTTTLPATTTTTTTTTACTSEPSLVTLNHLHHLLSGDHIYTTSPTRVSTEMNSGYVLEISPGLVATSASACLCETSFKPVIRLSKGTDDRFYTLSETEANNAVTMGYVREGIEFYCADQLNFCGATLALHRYKRTADHVYVTDPTAEPTVLLGATDEGIVCYIWPTV